MTTTAAHKATFKVQNYPLSGYAYKVEWTCSCGKKGSVTDGRSPATMKRAKSAHQNHAQKAN